MTAMRSVNGMVFKKLLVYVLSGVAAIAGFLFGFGTAVISGALAGITQEFTLSPLISGAVVCSVLVGAFGGATFSGRLADHYGRRNSLLLSSLLFITGSIFSALSTALWHLLLARVLVGVAIGIGSYTAPLYISEIAPFNKRGFLVSLNQLAIAVGILCAYFINLYYGGAWRMMLGFGALPAFILLLGLLRFPESPRWLCTQHRFAKAYKNLQLLRSTIESEQEFAIIHQSVTAQPTVGSWQILFAKEFRPVLLIGVFLVLAQQFTGINALIYFAPSIFQHANTVSSTTAIETTIAIGAINLLFTLLFLPLIDRLGRRQLLIFGLVGMLISLSLLSYSFSTQGHVSQALSLICVLLYIACFAISMGPMPFLLIAEIYPLEIRGIGMGFTLGCNWAANFLVSISFLPLITYFSLANTFALYALMSAITLYFVVNHIPETSGCSLEIITQNLRAGKPIRELGST